VESIPNNSESQLRELPAIHVQKPLGSSDTRKSHDGIATGVAETEDRSKMQLP
jgi:hypothetical protein